MSMTSRARAARAAYAAGVSTFTALGGHVLVGGHLPSLAAIAVPLALAFALALQLSARTSRWALALTVGLSQALFHLTFSIGSGALTVGSASAHAHHVDAVTVTGLAGGAESSAAMTAAHVAAAVLTYAALRRADVVLAAARGAAAWLARRLTAPAVGALPLAVAVATLTPARPGIGRELVQPISRRGPPLV